METIRMKIQDLKFDPHNVRRHPERQIEMLCKSLQRFGQRRPIVVHRTTRKVLAGNGLLDAASRLGYSEVDAILVDDDDETAKAFAIADNKSFELGTWDIDELIGAAAEIGEDVLSDLGFSEEEISKLLDPSDSVKKSDMFWKTGDDTAEPRRNQAVTFAVFTDDAGAINRAIDRAMDNNPPLFSRGHAFAFICKEFEKHENR